MVIILLVIYIYICLVYANYYVCIMIVMNRLKYLLSQSDIFSHFGAVKADMTGSNLGGTNLKPTSSASNLKGIYCYILNNMHTCYLYTILVYMYYL